MRINFLISTPSPLSASVETMVVVVLTVQVPVSTYPDPLCARPSTEDAKTVQVAANALCFAPEPSIWSVVVITLPQMPV